MPTFTVSSELLEKLMAEKIRLEAELELSEAAAADRLAICRQLRTILRDLLTEIDQHTETDCPHLLIAYKTASRLLNDEA